jgi:acetyltransferase-like isoleucine patch superfamily enzyme
MSLLLEKLLAVPSLFSRELHHGIANEVQRRRLPGVRFATGVIVRGAERIRTGTDVFFDHRAFLTCNFPDGFIHLGDNVEIGPYSILWGGGGITIGSDVHLGAHVHITSMEGVHVPADSFDPMKPLEIARKPVVIGSHVLICSNSVIVPGVTIGHHAMVAAGAIVVDDVPSYALVAGCPAKVLRYNNKAAPHVTVGSA